jgi:hypothetical protein
VGAAEELEGWDCAGEEVVAGPEDAVAVEEEDLPMLEGMKGVGSQAQKERGGNVQSEDRSGGGWSTYIVFV